MARHTDDDDDESPKRELDDAGVEKAARDLVAREWYADAIKMLSTMVRNFCRHEKKTALPCLCRKCASEAWEATAGDETYKREFVVCEGRCLHFWVPAELTKNENQLERLRNSMRASLTQRIAANAKDSRDKRDMKRARGNWKKMIEARMEARNAVENPITKKVVK